MATMRKTELRDTVALMNSADYKERFKAEYIQTHIRYEKLRNMIVRYEAGTLDFEPSCPMNLLKQQACAMENYLFCLEARAQIEGIDNFDIKEDI